MKYNFLISVVFTMICLYFTVVDLKAFVMTYSAISLLLGVFSGYLTYWNAKNVLAHLNNSH